MSVVVLTALIKGKPLGRTADDFMKKIRQSLKKGATTQTSAYLKVKLLYLTLIGLAHFIPATALTISIFVPVITAISVVAFVLGVGALIELTRAAVRT